jgi:hypothetical protein
MHFIHLIVIQIKILLFLSNLIVLFAYNEWYFVLHALFLYLWHEIPVKAELQKMKWNCEIMVSNYRNLFSRYTLLYIIVYIGM